MRRGIWTGVIVFSVVAAVIVIKSFCEEYVILVVGELEKIDNKSVVADQRKFELVTLHYFNDFNRKPQPGDIVTVAEIGVKTVLGYGDLEPRDIWLHFMIVRILFFGVFLSVSGALLVNPIERKIRKILKN